MVEMGRRINYVTKNKEERGGVFHRRPPADNPDTLYSHHIGQTTYYVDM